MLRSLWNRRGAAALCVLTIALSVALLLGVERLRHEARQSFLQTVSGVDLIVGARSHPVQLLLYSVFHLGEPTQDIRWASHQRLLAHPQVAWAIPLSLGDSHRGFRVIGTSSAFFDHFHYSQGRPIVVAQGRPFSRLLDAVIGAEVAAQLGYDLNQELLLSHGTVASRADHGDYPFRVVGILDRTGTPIDQGVYVSLQAIEAIHQNWRGGTRLPSDGRSEAELEAAAFMPTHITVSLVGLKARQAVFLVQRAVNDGTQEPLTAILPGVALQQLWGLLGTVERALLATAGCVVAVGLIGMLSVLLATLNERRREMALLRAIGATRRTVFGLILGEAALLVAVGAALGWWLLQAGIATAESMLTAKLGMQVSWRWMPTLREWQWLGGIWIAACMAAALPALLAMRRSVADGITVRT
jgi:putative ABC transport system permease protein